MNRYAVNAFLNGRATIGNFVEIAVNNTVLGDRQNGFQIDTRRV